MLLPNCVATRGASLPVPSPDKIQSCASINLCQTNSSWLAEGKGEQHHPQWVFPWNAAFGFHATFLLFLLYFPTRLKKGAPACALNPAGIMTFHSPCKKMTASAVSFWLLFRIQLCDASYRELLMCLCSQILLKIFHHFKKLKIHLSAFFPCWFFFFPRKHNCFHKKSSFGRILNPEGGLTFCAS